MYFRFSFKTKGNLTKHMKSKSHAKKCEELGISPFALPEDMIEHRNLDGTQMETIPGDSDSEDPDSDGDDQSDGSEIEYIKMRLPQEQEAARCLLSLSMTPPITINPTAPVASDIYNPSVSGYERHNGEDLSVKAQQKAAATKAVQKVSFEFPRTEQYYSNPNMVVRHAGADDMYQDDLNLPMDLTKPRQENEYPRFSSIQKPMVTEILGPAGLLSSLVSITDRIPCHNMPTESDVNESALLQQYLKEKAMVGTKMRQQQQKGLEAESVAVHLKNGYREMASQGELRTNVNSLLPAESENLPQWNEPEKQLESTEGGGGGGSSGMDTLANIAVNSKKMDVHPTNGDVDCKDTKNLLAKNVASEYLKLTTRNQNQKSDREDGESNSDQDMPPSSGGGCSSGGKKRPDSVSEMVARALDVVKDRQKANSSEFLAGNATTMAPRRIIPTAAEDMRAVCDQCGKYFQKPSQLKLHMNIHYLERKYKCELCSVSFRTAATLLKHERSVAHQNKLSMTSTFGVPTATNPRPYKCIDCKSAFRIHGHLAKHLRSKSHVLQLESLGKIPHGTYLDLERVCRLTDIDTTDCDNAVISLKLLARQLNVDGSESFVESGPKKEPALLTEKRRLTEEEAEDEEDGEEDHNNRVGSVTIENNTNRGEDSDNEDYVNDTSNGRGEELLASGNKNCKTTEVRGVEEDNRNGITLKRKFGTMLVINDSDEGAESGGGGAALGQHTLSAAISEGSNESTVVAAGNQFGSTKILGQALGGVRHSSSTVPEKRLKLV